MSQNVKVYRTLDFYKSSGGAKLATFDCDDSSTVLYLRPATTDTESLNIGDGTTDMDVKVFLGSTSEYVLFDVGNSYMALACPLVPAASDGAAIGSATLMWSDLFLASGGVINFNNGDVTLTHSTGALAVAATWATAAATGRPFGVTLTVNAALGGWSNALKGYVAYGTAGSTTGLGSAVNAEILLSTGTTSGTYAPLESELVANSAVSSGTATSFMYMNIAGSNSTGKTTLNTNGYLFELGAGVVDTSSGMFDVATTTPTTVEFDAQLRIRVGGVNYYIPLSADTSFE